MGTRSLTFVHDDNDGADPIVCVYQQYDGYFDGVGDQILDFLRGTTVVNGIPGGDDRKIFNGAGDLAARLVTHFKGGNANRAGNVYIESANLADGDMGTEFAYHIYCTVGSEPMVVARDLYADFEVEGPASEIVWPERDEDGNYIVAAAEVDTSGPLSDDQRSALFVLFNEVFETTEQDARFHFTRSILGKGTRSVSWSSTSPHAITANEASRLLDVLSAIDSTLIRR